MSTLNTSFWSDPLGFATHNSLCPANAPSNQDIKRDWSRTPLEDVFDGWTHSSINPTSLISVLQLDKKRNMYRNGVGVNAKFLTGAGETGIPAYFLPWDSTGGVVEMTIPAHVPNLQEKQSPRLFFTAALSGCSIFVKGDPNNPTIYHCGTSVKGPTDSPAFYQRMVMTCKVNGIGQAARGHIHSAPKTSYLQPRHRSPYGSDEYLVTSNLESSHEGEIVVARTYDRWGAVFGVRYGDNWEIYLQRNMSVGYVTLNEVVRRTKKNWWSKNKTTRNCEWSKIRYESYPASIEKIFPGTGKVEMVLDNVIINI